MCVVSLSAFTQGVGARDAGSSEAWTAAGQGRCSAAVVAFDAPEMATAQSLGLERLELGDAEHNKNMYSIAEVAQFIEKCRCAIVICIRTIAEHTRNCTPLSLPHIRPQVAPLVSAPQWQWQQG